MGLESVRVVYETQTSISLSPYEAVSQRKGGYDGVGGADGFSRC